MTFNWKKEGKRILMVLFASVLMAFNIKILVRTGGLYPGGVTGLTVLIQRLAQRYLSIEIPFTLVNVLLNAFPVYIGFRFIGKRFTLLSLMMIVVSSVLTDLIPARVITYDTLLIAVFGGILSGAAVSLCLRAGATSGGTDFIAIHLSQKRGVDSWNTILGFNVLLLCVAGFFFGWDKALYSIIFQFASTQVLRLLYRDYQQQTLFIVTKKPREVCEVIDEVCHHGATLIDAEGSHDRKPVNMVYSVVSGKDAKIAIRAVREVDSEAFVNSIRTTEIRGRFYMRPHD